MTTYTFSITVNIDADDLDSAWDDFADLMTQPRFLRDGVEVTTENDEEV